jgi:serine O-acetyltransferase
MIQKNSVIILTINYSSSGGGVTVDDIAAAAYEMSDLFLYSSNKYFMDALFSESHTTQYLILLYTLSKNINVTKPLLATQLYGLNKMLNCVDMYYQINMPHLWFAEHPIGSVMGRATYSNGFAFYQGCTVGGSNGKYPIIGKNVLMYSNSSILGNSKIGDNVIISANTLVINKNVPANTIVFNRNSDLIIIEKSKKYMQEKMSNIWNEKYFESEVCA